MSVLVTGSAVRTCLGDAEATYRALLAGRSGVGRLHCVDGGRINVPYGYQIGAPGRGRRSRLASPAGWLAECVRAALAQARVDCRRERVVAIVGTGLRELAAIEPPVDQPVPVERLHFADPVRRAAPGVADVVTVANACSAGGYALALAQDLLEAGDADAAVVGGADGMTVSMLAMIGRVADRATEQVRPFDVARRGVLLGEGAAALVLVGRHRPPPGRPQARILATGLSCDAGHETAPDADGISRAIRDAYARAGRTPQQADLIVAHGTGTGRNDPTEAAVIAAEVGTRPLVTAIKGGIGHTSGASALMSLDVAMRCLRGGPVPPVVGLRTPIAEAAGLRLVTGAPVPAEVRLAQVNSFGFGGVNAVTLAAAP